MINFPLFSELEEKRDRANAFFHRETKPQLVERLGQFGFKPSGANGRSFALAEKATQNIYLLTIRPYEITIRFEHIRTNEHKLICEISNFGLSAHDMMNVIVASVDSWLQYGVVYDYIAAQKIMASVEKDMNR
jgi:hypothetical protein